MTLSGQTKDQEAIREAAAGQAYQAGEGGGGGHGEVPGGLCRFRLSNEEAAASGPGPVLL